MDRQLHFSTADPRKSCLPIQKQTLRLWWNPRTAMVADMNFLAIFRGWLLALTMPFVVDDHHDLIVEFDG